MGDYTPQDGEKWDPPQKAMEAAYDKLGLDSASEEASNDDSVAQAQYKEAAQTSMRDAEKATGNYKQYDPKKPNPN